MGVVRQCVTHLPKYEIDKQVWMKICSFFTSPQQEQTADTEFSSSY